MAVPTLFGPYPLTTKGVEENIPVKSPGVYALGSTRANTFYITYVGRSDEDVAARLKNHVALPDPQFKFTYASSAVDAFEKECELYHEYRTNANQVHPARPQGSNRKCPRCKIFD